MSLKVELIAVAGNELRAQFGARDMADNLDVVDGRYTFVVGEGHGEEEFIVLAAIEGCGVDVEVEFLGSNGRLVVDGDAFFVEAATRLTASANVHDFRRKAVANVHHGRGADTGLAQALHEMRDVPRV